MYMVLPNFPMFPSQAQCSFKGTISSFSEVTSGKMQATSSTKIVGSSTYELLTVPSFLCHKYISIHFRIIQLWEPFKENQLTRSVESWQNLVTKLRQLLLVSFNRHLGKFEDQVRALREKRTEPRWSFTTYFSLHVS